MFYFLSGLILLSLFVAVERDNGVIATITMLVAGLIAYFVYDFNVITWTIANINTVIMWVVAYFVIAVLWAKGKWALLIRAMLRAMKVEGYTSGKFYFRGRYQHVPARASENKESIMMWMMYWPVSMTWTIINDPVRRAFNAIYDVVANSFQKDSDAVFKDYVKKNES